MMSETLQHVMLKKHAINLLISRGYKNNEIFEEYRWKDYIIDIAGVKKDKTTFIECGTIRISKYNKLRKNFNIRFIHLPYLKKSIIYPPKLNKRITNGVITSDTKITQIGEGAYLLIPSPMLNDSTFPFEFGNNLSVEIKEGKLFVTKNVK